MSKRRIEKLPSLSGVAAGSTAVLNCPVGLTYDFISLVTNISDLTKIKNIEVRVNGKTLQYFADAAELDIINQYHGRDAASNGDFKIWFMRPELPSIQIPFKGAFLDQRYLTSFGTSDVQTMSVHFEIDGTVASPTAEAYAQKSDAQPLGLITKVKAFPRTFATSGQQEIDSLPRSGARIAAIHLFKSDIGNVEVEVDGKKVVTMSKSVAESLQSDFNKNPYTAGATHVDFVMNGSLDDALRTMGVQDLRVRPSLGTSGLVKTVVEYIDGFEGI